MKAYAYILGTLLLIACVTPVVEEWPEEASPLANAVAEVESLEQPPRTVGPDLPEVEHPGYLRETRIADLPLEGSTESHICPPPVIEEPTVTATEQPTTVAKALMLVIVLGVPLLAASIYLALGTYRARKIAKEFRGLRNKS